MKDSARDIAAWRNLARLIPGWRPTLAGLRKLDEGPNELGAAIRSVGRGWSYDDARWDVLQGVLEFSKRQHAQELAEKIRAERGTTSLESGHHFFNGMNYAADLIDPKAQRASTEGDTT
ncbi:hypothetical protein [Streptomyces antibioticus]|uniref:hypothetical protein n=1 Tax=Streptomyces antibioticus TaxID=1890 RepID=UPI0033F9282E